MQKHFYLLFILVSILFISCENDLDEVRKFGYYEDVPSEIAKEVEMLYSDSFRVQVRVLAPTLERYSGNVAREEFNNGLEVEFIGDNLRPNSHLTANKAVKKIISVLDENNRMIREPVVIITDNVILANANGDTLKTEKLIWYENSSRLSSDKFVVIIKPDEIIYGYGMDTDKDFGKWRIRSVAGQFRSNRFSEGLSD